MTIYATPFDVNTMKWTAASSDSGFKSLNEVIQAMGSKPIARYPKFIIYGDNKNRVAFSHIVFHIDEPDNKDYSLLYQTEAPPT